MEEIIYDERGKPATVVTIPDPMFSQKQQDDLDIRHFSAGFKPHLIRCMADPCEEHLRLRQILLSRNVSKARKSPALKSIGAE